MTGANWSVPESEVLAGVRDVLDGDHRGVLATVVAVEGSAYRRPGAKMVIPEEGTGSGHITAGCLEDELQRVSGDVLDAGESRIERYDLRPDAEEDVWGLGVGCNGVLDILLEPIDESHRPMADAVAEGRDVGVVTVLDAADEALVGERAYYHPGDGDLVPGAGFPASVTDRVRDIAADLTEQGRADTVELSETTVFVDGIAAPDDLVVVGTGNDVDPIVEVGKRAGFVVTVVGFRGATATTDRFPAADEVVSTSPARITDAVEFDADTAVVLATHNFVDDRLALDELLATDTGYVGLLGPRERFEEMQGEFREEGRTFTEAELDRLYTPVGLDLGGGSPYQIALSIVSEVLAVRNDREPQHLKERAGPIHERVDVTPTD
jgi:xanthine dehydrogenase accessory factor